MEVKSEMDASVWQVLVAPGQAVAEDEDLVILESMKMEIPVVAPCAGTVTELLAQAGDSVKMGQVLVVLEP